MHARASFKGILEGRLALEGKLEEVASWLHNYNELIWNIPPAGHISIHTLSYLEEMILIMTIFLREKTKQHTEKYMLFRVHDYCYCYHLYSAQDSMK